MSTRVILADDHEMIRASLRGLLEQEAGMEVVGEAEDGRRAVELVGEVSPDVVVMDVDMPVLNGVEATRQIRTRFSHVKVIALSMHNDPRFVAGMLGAGAFGYLLKDSAFDELVTAIRAAMANASPGVETA